MDLQNISNVELVNRMQKLVRTERKITHLILLHILEIESRRIYADLGYDGMYTYLTRGLGYSEAAAYRRLQSARLLKQVPEVAAKVESGALHLSQLTQVQKCLKASAEKGAMISSVTTLEVLEKLQNKNSFETGKVLAQAFDLPIKTQDILRPQSNDSVRLEITLTAGQFKELQEAKDSLSHVCFEGTWSQVIAALAEKFNRKMLTKADRTKSKVKFENQNDQNQYPANITSVKTKSDKEAGFQVPEKSPDISTDLHDTPSTAGMLTQRVIAAKVGRRKYISVKTKRNLLAKANSSCEFVNNNTGVHCGSRFQLQFDHVQPVALGGSDDIENLRVLCRTHNLIMAKRLGLVNRRLS